MDQPDLLDYVVFFESQPEWIADEGWTCGARFNASRGEDTVVALLAPDDGEFAVSWWQGEKLRLKFRSTAVAGWHLESAAGRESLRMTYLEDERLKYCILQLKPHVFIEWQMTW